MLARARPRGAARFDPSQHIGCGQRAAHLLEHDAIDVRMIGDHAPADWGPAVLVRGAPVRAGMPDLSILSYTVAFAQGV
jgi:hypothetical protein